uniref:Uncharacterized protein n=1 Tax=Oryza brachyantha TaxID=4533 RepID=J3M8G3_ORYBR
MAYWPPPLLSSRGVVVVAWLTSRQDVTHELASPPTRRACAAVNTARPRRYHDGRWVCHVLRPCPIESN